MWDPQITIEEVNDPAEVARFREHRARADKNWAWLQAHWQELLPAAYGKYIAVADQEAFVADTLDAALQWVRTYHPEDTGRIVEHIWPPKGPRIYSGGPC